MNAIEWPWLNTLMLLNYFEIYFPFSCLPDFPFISFCSFFVFRFILLSSLSGLLILKKWKTFLTIITQKSCQHQPVKLQKFCNESTWPKIEEVSSFTKWMKTYRILQKKLYWELKVFDRKAAKFSSFLWSEEFIFSSEVILSFRSNLLYSLRLPHCSHSLNETGARWAFFACNSGWVQISTAQELFFD